MSESAEPIVCATYTHARRHPMVLGRIAGWTPPFQLTVTQLGVLVGSFLMLVWTWDLWSTVLPGSLATMLVLGAPMSLAWAVRRVKVEGRSIARAGLGFAMLWSAPASGVVSGRPVRDRCLCAAGGRVFVAGGGS